VLPLRWALRDAIPRAALQFGEFNGRGIGPERSWEVTPSAAAYRRTLPQPHKV